MKSSLPLLWQPQRIMRGFCFPGNRLRRRRSATSSIWAPSSPYVSSPSPSVSPLTPPPPLALLLQLKTWVVLVCRTRLISPIFFKRNYFRLLTPPQIRRCLFAMLSVYSGLITVYLIHPGGQFWITSKQKLWTLKALWARVTAGTVSPHQEPCHPCFWSEINIYKWIIDSIYNILREGTGEICMFGALQRHT